MIDLDRWLRGVSASDEEEESAVTRTLRMLGQVPETIGSYLPQLPAVSDPAFGPGYGPQPLAEGQTPWIQSAGPVIQQGATGLYDAAMDPTNAVETGKRAIQAGYAAAADAYVPDTLPEIATAAVMPSLHFSNVAQAGWGAATGEIGRGLGRAAGTSTDPLTTIPGYGPVSSEDVASGVAQTVLDPTNFIGAGPARAAVRAAPRVGRELAEGAVRVGGSVADDVGRRAAGVADNLLAPGMAPDEGMLLGGGFVPSRGPSDDFAAAAARGVIHESPTGTPTWALPEGVTEVSTPISAGLSSGYSPDDIKAFYLNRRWKPEWDADPSLMPPSREGSPPYTREVAATYAEQEFARDLRREPPAVRALIEGRPAAPDGGGMLLGGGFVPQQAPGAAAAARAQELAATGGKQATIDKWLTLADAGADNADELAQKVSTWEFGPTAEEARAMLGAERPEYLDGVATFLLSQRRKLLAGQMTTRDAAKAYNMTLMSMQARAHGFEGMQGKLASGFVMESGEVVPGNAGLANLDGMTNPRTGEALGPIFAEPDAQGRRMIRPESVGAAWNWSPDGQRALDGMSRGHFDEEAWQSLTRARKALGSDIVTNNGALRPLTEAEIESGAVFNMRNLPQWTRELNEGIAALRAEGRHGEIGAWMTEHARKLNGIGEAKTAFIKQLMGMGDALTIDAREINYWLGGRGLRRRGNPSPGEKLAAAVSAHWDDPRVGQATRAAIERKVNGLTTRYPELLEGIDPDDAGEIIHHWIWDKSAGSTTTHAAEQLTQQLASGFGGGRPTVEVLQDRVGKLQRLLADAQARGDQRLADDAMDVLAQTTSELVDARHARLALEPRIRSDVGRRADNAAALGPESADAMMSARYPQEAVRADAGEFSGPVSVPVDQSRGRLNAGVNALLPGPGLRGQLRADAYNAAQGGVFGAASEELKAGAEDREADPWERLKSGAIGAGMGVLAGRGLGSRRAAAAARAVGGGMVPMGPPAGGAPGPLPPAAARAATVNQLAATAATPQAGQAAAGAPQGIPPAIASIFPNLPGAYAAAKARNAAEMAAKGITPASPLEIAGGTAGTVSYGAMLGPASATVNFAQGIWNPIWAIPKEPLRAGQRAVQHGNLAALREPGEALKGTLKGLGQVSDAVWDVLRAKGQYAPHPDAPNISQRVADPLGRGVLQALELPGRVWSGLPDAVFGTIAQHTVERRRAAQLATEAGKTGKAWSDWVDLYVKEADRVRSTGGPAGAGTADVLAAGKTAAEKVALRSELGSVGKHVKTVATMGGKPVISQIVAPFFNSQWNAWLQTAERGPLGAVMNRQKGFDKAYDAAVGSALTLGIVNYAWGSHGVSGSGPSDSHERKMMIDEGWRPYSTKVGGVWYPNRAFGPAEQLLNSAGELHDGLAYQKKDADSRALTMDALSRVGKLVKQQPYATGYATIADLLQFGPAAAAADLATRVTPFAATARAIGTAADTKEREVDRGANVPLGEEFAQRWQQSTGQRSDLPVAQDVLGREKENPQPGILAFTGRMGWEHEDPIISAFQGAGVSIGDPPDAVESVPLTPDEQRRWNTLRGQSIIKDTERMVTAGTLEKLPPARQAERLEAIKADASRRAAAELRREVGAAEWRRRQREAEAKEKAAS